MTRVIDPVMKELRETLLLMGSRSEAILEKAVRSITSRNLELAGEVAHDDLEIDRLDVKVDDKVLQALALQAPVASDLREVVGIKMIATDLERVGDLARNIAKSAKRLAGEPAAPIPDLLVRLARAAQDMLRTSLNAFSETDSRAARAVLDADALQVLGDEDDVDRHRGQARRAGQLRQLLADDLVLHVVELVVGFEHRPRVPRVHLREGVDGPAQHVRGGQGQAHHQIRNRRGRLASEEIGALGEVPGQFAHPLEVGGDHLDADHLAEVVGHRSLEGQGAQHGLVDGEVEAIDLEVVDLDLPGQCPVPLPDGAQGLVEDRLGQPPHAEQLVAEIVQDGVDDAGHGYLYPKRPVM